MPAPVRIPRNRLSCFKCFHPEFIHRSHSITRLQLNHQELFQISNEIFQLPTPSLSLHQLYSSRLSYFPLSLHFNKMMPVQCKFQIIVIIFISFFLSLYKYIMYTSVESLTLVCFFRVINLRSDFLPDNDFVWWKFYIAFLSSDKCANLVNFNNRKLIFTFIRLVLWRFWRCRQKIILD